MNMKWRVFHHMPQSIFQLLTQIKRFSYHFTYCYETKFNTTIARAIVPYQTILSKFKSTKNEVTCADNIVIYDLVL